MNGRNFDCITYYFEMPIITKLYSATVSQSLFNRPIINSAWLSLLKYVVMGVIETTLVAMFIQVAFTWIKSPRHIYFNIFMTCHSLILHTFVPQTCRFWTLLTTMLFMTLKKKTVYDLTNSDAYFEMRFWNISRTPICFFWNWTTC